MKTLASIFILFLSSVEEKQKENNWRQYFRSLKCLRDWFCEDSPRLFLLVTRHSTEDLLVSKHISFSSLLEDSRQWAENSAHYRIFGALIEVVFCVVCVPFLSRNFRKLIGLFRGIFGAVLDKKKGWNSYYKST